MWHAWERGETCTGFWWESTRERGHLKDQGVDGIKMDLRETGWCGVEWIHLAQDRDGWRAVVNAVMNLRVVNAVMNLRVVNAVMNLRVLAPRSLS
jgi:alpha-glucosidase (family GH31 glycosyl hydrolase)